MKKLKWKTLVLALLLAALGTVSAGTLAYFTADDTAHNVITSGGVDIELVEKTYNDNNELIDWPKEGVTGVMPGESVPKIVTVKNKGETAAWVRVRADVTITRADGQPSDTSLIEINFDTENWTEKDGWWYCNEPVEGGETTEFPLFTEVTFKTAMDNPYQNCETEIDVSAQAVQVANNGETVMEAAGWPEA